MAITSPASINWQGSTGASGYDIQRRELDKGVWTTIETGISDAEEAYRPFIQIKKPWTGKSYIIPRQGKKFCGRVKMVRGCGAC
jgi:hypothetical protein